MRSDRRTIIGSLGYLAFVGMLSIGGLLYAASNYFVGQSIQSQSISDAEKAVAFEKWNPYAFEAGGDALIGKEDRAAAEWFEKAVALRPDDFRLWIKLGDARSRAEQHDNAERAYLKAIELAPNYGTPRLQLGLQYLERGSKDKAFEQLGAAARLDPLYYPVVFHHAESAFAGDASAIESAITPTSKNERLIFAIHLIQTSRMTESIRRFLLGNELTFDEKKKLIGLLKERKNYRLAREVWLTTLDPEIASQSEHHIFDGGFELISRGSEDGFDWTVDDDPYTSVSRNQGDVHSGSWALKIRFSGNAELQKPIVSQIAFVEVGKRYRLTFYVRAEEMISGGLPAVVVSDVGTGQLRASSKPIANTNGAWEERTMLFTATEPLVLISVQRPNCSDRRCPIFGELSIDDLALERDH